MTNRRNGVLYVGVTGDLVARCYQHRHYLVEGFTKQHGFTRLVYFDPYDDISMAAMKHWPRSWKVRLINGVNREWNDLADRLQLSVDGGDKPGHDDHSTALQ
jgi:putative endonuclease